MNISTKFSPGDKVWARWDGKVSQGTVGQVRVEITDSPGLNDGRIDPRTKIAFDNFKAKQERVESYMLVETGIGSGQIYTLGKDIFGNKEEAESALKDSL